MSSLISLRNHLKSLKDKHRVMDKQITEDYDLHVDDQVVHQEKLDKLDLKREITQLEEQIKILEEQA
ncbi:hypothetical protein N9O93_01685 [bacterium]|mgnify:FL=1|nr:hypothetical protein [Hellea sp.]MDA9047729.1 hypothetical protein [Hellea sp.]MDA9225385.1 hypothetical protein [bacterium]